MNCIGAIDGTHVFACVPSSVRGAYRDRNNEITQNVLAACSHDMMFTYVVTGWEGSSHDSRILSDAATLELFPASYGEQYYVVDAGFPNIPGYLAPCKGQRVIQSTSRIRSLENVFITILLEKFTRTHTTYWKAKDWEQMNKELEEQFPGTILDANKLLQKLRRLRIQYTQFTELIGHTGVCWDETTNTVKANADV
ncbi:hypothetical protein CRG98_027072 [Punica granatum]|uniref:DDE Tnp4 domain-containing protein n=1 Tax=Punica granatum TaxID=22663 RepID=A0A2I0J9D3_PUNGR|nr:hypothetical protein CRG98_027072 [Punica granatum]